MKKIVLFIIAVAWSAMSYSQDYYPLVENEKAWSVMVVHVNYPNWWDTTATTLNCYLSGDTIFNNVAYTKLLFSDEPAPVSWNLAGFMREDVDHKVWMKDAGTSDEILLYDFALAAGDSTILGNSSGAFLHVDSITSILVNGSPRQKYHLSTKQGYDYHETWIEGVGSNKGIIFSGTVYWTGGHYWYLCMTHNGELVYQNPNYNFCYFTNVSIQETDNPVFQAYPNPSGTGSVVLSFGNQAVGNTMLKVFDMHGQQVHTQNISSHQHAINLSTTDWSAGVYIAAIFSDGLLIAKCKIIVE